MTTGAIRSAAIRSAAEIPSSTGIFTSKMARSGLSAVTFSMAALAVGRLGDHRVALLFEHLLEIQADQRLIFRNNDTQRILAHGQEPTGEHCGPFSDGSAFRAQDRVRTARDCAETRTCGRLSSGAPPGGGPRLPQWTVGFCSKHLPEWCE